MKKKKGFTLTELIIVLAIIAILSAIIFPSWAYAMSRARIKANNNSSRVIFNAAQTAAIKLNFQERKLEDDEKFMGGGKFVLYCNKGEVKAARSDAPESDDWFTGDDVEAFAQQINNMFTDSDEAVYKVYIDEYLVQSVVVGATDNDRRFGSYPTTITSRSSGDRKTVSNTGIESVNMNIFVLNSTTPVEEPEEAEDS